MDDEQKFRNLHERLQENYLKREKEFKNKSKKTKVISQEPGVHSDL
ncbi:hypothetical protein [Paenibacillus rigui]|nr:hypothetical protein [Paenibacillus rigui]